MSEWKMTPELSAELDAMMALEASGHPDPWGIHADAEARQKVADQYAIDNPCKTVVADTAEAPQSFVGNKRTFAINLYESLSDKRPANVRKALMDAGFKKATATTYSYQLKNWV